MELLHKLASTLYYCTMAPLLTINTPIPESISSPLMTTTQTFHSTHPADHLMLVMLQLPDNPYHCKYQVFQYIQLWQELQSAPVHHGPLLPDVVLADLWAQMLGPFHDHWLAVLQANNPSELLRNLVQQFFSLLHLFGSKWMVPPALVPNRIQAGDRLAHYHRLDLQAPQIMPPCNYFQQFQLVFSTLNCLKQ